MATRIYTEEQKENNRIRARKYNKEHKEEISIKRKERYYKDPVECSRKSREYHHNNKEECNARNRIYYVENKESLLAYQKQYREDNKDYVNEVSKIYYENNKDKIIERSAEWAKNNPDKRKDTINRYNEKNKEALAIKRNDPVFKAKRAAQHQTPQGKYVGYKSAAKARNLCFDLTLEEFTEYYQKPCEYCNNPIKAIGLDRIDNSIGYTKENIKVCCEVCNKMKRSYSEEFFYEHIHSIINFNKEPFNISHINKSNRYAGYRSDAARRGLEFTVTSDEFKSLVSTSCSYCGSTEKIGIDRINNDEGYTLTNSVACCKHCNLMKYVHDKDFFLSHINKIYNHSILKVIQ